MIILYIILAGLLYIYFDFTITMQKNILGSIVLSNNKKIFHSIMIWIIPFLWYYLFKDFIISKTETMTKDKRDKLLKKESGGFYESKKGIWGG